MTFNKDILLSNANYIRRCTIFWWVIFKYSEYKKEEAQYMGKDGRSSEKRSFDQSLIFDDGLLIRSTVALVPKTMCLCSLTDISITDGICT
jgi:hypothetical protein